MDMTWTVVAHEVLELPDTTPDRQGDGNVRVTLRGGTGGVATYSMDMYRGLREARETYPVGTTFTSRLTPAADPLDGAS